MDTVFNHKKNEEKVYKKWEAANSFSPSNKRQAKPFSIIMPPPNANDPLHIGHALFVTVEDILIRYHRMKGDTTLWLPGTDHAGIETQFVFEKKLAKKDKSRFDFDRDSLYKMIWDYVKENSDVALNQMKKLGASADWERFTFTLDPKVVEFVYDTFIKLKNDDLVYRDERLVNYCVKCGTGYSELEIEYEERVSPLYYVRYPMAEDKDEFVVVATVRPEPIFADTHLAVNPKDKTKKHLIGKEVINPMTGATMTIIADEFVDPEFGTGVVKLTPAHDANDWSVAQKHNIERNIAVNMQGKLTQMAGEFAGLKVAQARKQVVDSLTKKGLIEKIDEKYTNRIATCYRCHSVIEPMPLPQFFVSVKPLTAKALDAIKNKEVKVHGVGREKILINWLTDLKDWNISRQIVWGIRIPVWYKADENPEISLTFLSKSGEKVRGLVGELIQKYSLKEISSGLQNLIAPKNATYTISVNAPGDGYIQETDTFDTWFSSGQWPVVTLKIREGDFERFYPTSVMETAYDILPFWVMRMLMMGIYLTGEVPFKDIYFHGLVRDEKGRKMSKSIGNVINPLDIVEKYGADALRMALVMSTTPGQDKNVGENQIKAMRNLSNKIWNAARYTLLSKKDVSEGAKDKEIIEKIREIKKDVTEKLEKLKVGQAAEEVYKSFWHWFCDEIIEEHKKGEVSDKVLESTLLTFLTLLHPFTPFVTETVWSEFSKEPLIVSPWPDIS